MSAGGRRAARSSRLLAVCAALSISFSAGAIDLRNVSLEKLDNGMTVMLLEDRNFPVVSVQMVYRVGARNETTGLTGLAHFVEHMAFRASENFPGTGLVSSIYARGGEWHGYTWTDLTTYFATVPAGDLDLLLRIEADRMARLDLSRDVIEAERGAVLAEMHMYENDPSSMLVDALMFTSFLVHPYRNNTIGVESDIEAITYDDVAEFYRAHYHPGNAVLSVVGDFDRDAVLDRVGDLFGGMETGTATPLPHTVEPRQTGERRVRVTGSIDARRFAIGYRAPSSKHDDFATFLVLQAILGGSSGASFLQNDWGTPVRAGSVLDGAAGDLATWYPPSAQDYIFLIAGTLPDGLGEAEAEARIEERLSVFRTAAPSADQLSAGISNVLDELVYDVETTEDAAHQLAYYESIGALDALLSLPKAVAAVTAEDVRRAAGRYLGPEQRTVAWYASGGGRSPGDSAVARPIIEAGEPLPVDETPVPAPLLRQLGGGLELIVQQSDLSSAVEIGIVVAGNTVAGDGFLTNYPVHGYSTRTVRARPGELRQAFADIAASLANASLSEPGDAGESADPETRLEQAFASLMASPVPPEVLPSLLVVSGDVAVDEAIALAETHFGEVPAAAWQAPDAGGIPPGERVVRLGQPVAQAALGYIVNAPGAAEPGFDAWRILLYILSHGYEGRLGVEAIARRGLAYYVDSRYRSDGPNGWITLSIGVDPEKLPALKAVLLDELQGLLARPPSAAEVDEARAWLVGRSVSAAQSNAELGRRLAADWLVNGSLLSNEALAERLERVSEADVRRAAAQLTRGLVIELRHDAAEQGGTN